MFYLFVGLCVYTRQLTLLITANFSLFKYSRLYLYVYLYLRSFFKDMFRHFY